MNTWMKIDPDADSTHLLRFSASSMRLRAIASGSMPPVSGNVAVPTTHCRPLPSTVSRATGTFAFFASISADRIWDFIRSMRSTKTWTRAPQLRGCEFFDIRGDKPPRGDTGAGETSAGGMSPSPRKTRQFAPNDESRGLCAPFSGHGRHFPRTCP
ncbi:MAG: hypothetical protein ACREYE_21760 [Gammaproteobacteria bacterium]